MAVTKTIQIDGRPVTFKASAAIPRLYRDAFHRDIYRDLTALQSDVEDSDPAESTLDAVSLEVFENIAWLMARHANPTDVPADPLEWLDGFDTFSIYEVLPDIISLWGLNTQTTAIPKDRQAPRTGR